MNKIYKLIWSKVKNCWVVTSEMAKGHGKNKSRVQNSLLAAFVTAALLAGGVTDVQALTQQEKDEIKAEVARDLLSQIKEGKEIPGVTSGVNTIPGAIAYRIQYFNDIAPAISDQMIKKGLARQYFSVRPDYIEPSRDYLGRYAKSDWTNVDNDGAFGAHSMALGYRAFSEAKHGVAIGRSALAGGSLWKGDYGGGGVAIGNSAWALGDKSVSVGNAARAVHKGIAIGIQAEAGLDEDDNITDLTLNPDYTPKQGKSIQYDPKTKLPYVTSDITKKFSAIAIGTDAKAWGSRSTAIGTAARATASHAWSIGNSSEASAVDAIAFGNETSAKGRGAIAIGSDYEASDSGAQAYSGDTIAIGRGSVAGDKNDTATAYNTVAIGVNAKAVPDYTSKKVKDAVLLGANTTVKQERGTAVGANAYVDGASGAAFGDYASVVADEGLAIGKNAKVAYNSAKSIAIGSGAEVKNENAKPSEQAVAIGTGAAVGGNSSDAIAIGTGAKTQEGAQRSIVIGKGAVVKSYDSVVIGTNASAQWYNAVAIGNGAQATLSDGIALGSDSKTTVSSGYKGYDPYKNGFNIDAHPGAAWESTKAALSVGDVGKNITRQITSVAAGRNDTDAVNVAQLKKLRDYTDTKMNIDLGNITPKGINKVKDWAQEAIAVKSMNNDYLGIQVANSASSPNKMTYYLSPTQKFYDKMKTIDKLDRRTSELEDGWDLKLTTETEDETSAVQTLDVVEFGVANADSGLTVTRETTDAETEDHWGKTTQNRKYTIKFGIDSTKLVENINSAAPAVTNISAKFGVTDGTNTKAVNLGKEKKNAIKFLGTDKETTVTVGGADDAPTVTVGLDSKFTQRVTTNEGNIKKNTTAIDGLTTKVSANEGNITTNKNAIDALKPRVTANEGNITKLQRGFTLKDEGTGTADVKLGEDANESVIFKAAVDKKTDATAPTKSLTSSVDADRNVTYSLNINQLKKDLGITDGPGGVMSSWKLKATGGDTTEQDIKNGEAVTFDASGNGLTVKREGKTIKYGIDGSKIDISNNKSSVHYVSVHDAEKTGNFDNDGAKKDGGIAIGLRAESNGWNSIALGSDSKATGIQANGGWNIAIGASAKAEANLFGTAIGYMASATKDKAIALGTMAKTETEDGISIGAVSKSLGKRGIAIGSVSEVSTTGGLGIAIGNAAHVGPAKPSDTTAMPKPSDEWKPANPYESVDDNTKPGKNEGAQEKSIAIGFKAGAFGYQTTALGAGAQAHDSNTTAVGTAAVAKGHHSTALGMQARTFEKESTSVGHWADSRAEFATALGSNTIVYKKGGVALGFGARAYDENSIAIGSNSFAKEAIDGKAYLSDEEVKAAAGIVSVGNPAYKAGDKDGAANYRRIVNVAGGINDNDAVNVAQLKALAGKVTGNEGDITTLKEGWTLQDANKTVGTKTVKAKDTVTVTGDDYINATVNNDGLTLGMDETKLNKQINSQIDDSATVKAKMNSWVLKATSDKDAEKAGKTINNDNNAVTFDATGAGLTVTRDGSTITYGIDGKQIDISENETVAGLETEIKESKTTVEAAENSQITVTPKKQDDKSTKYVVDIAKDGTIDGDKDDNLVTGTTVKEYVDANKVTVTGDEDGSGVKVENIAEDGKPANYKVSLGDKIKAGDVTVDGTKGKGQITGLSNTTWDAGNIVSGRAATEDQLKEVSKNAAAEAAKMQTTVVAGDYVTVSEDTNANGGKEYTVTGPKVAVAKDEKNLVVDDIKEGEKKVGYQLKLNKELTGLTSVSSDKFKAGNDVTLDKTGLTIKNGPSVTTEGIDAGKKKITNVADGDVSATSTDAVNGKQLNEVKTKADTNEENITELQKGWTLADAKTGKKVVKADNTVTVTGDEYINATVSDAGLKLGMNVNNLNSQINKQINTNPTVTGKMNSWVLKAATTDKDPAATGQTIDNTNNVATFDVEDDAQGLTVKRENSTIKYGVDKAKLAEHITGDVVTNINKGGEAVTNISAKFSVTDGTNTKAVNLGKDKNSNVKFLGTAGETTVTVGGDNDAPTITVGLDKEFKNQVNANSDNIATNKTAIEKNAGEITTLKGRVDGHDTAIAANTKAIGENKAAIEKNAGEITTLKGRVDGHDTAIAANTKAIGENKAAITQNAQDIATNKTAIGENKTAIAENKTNIATNTENIGKNADAIAENKAEISKKMTSWNLKAEGVDGEQKIGNDGTVTFDVVEKDKGLTVTREGSTIKYGIDGSKIDIKENETVKKLEEDIENSKTTVKAGDDNISVKKADGKNEYTLTLAEDLKGLKSISSKTVNASEKVTIGDNVTINNEGLTIKDGPSVKKDGIDAGGKTITNVADGKADTDAVNVRQLNAIASQGNQNIAILGGKVSELDGRIDRVGAGAAALAALHPLDFDPDDKWDFAAGYGNYSGANAVAIGAYYRPNEDTMFSVGGSFGGGENMVNAGVSVKLGQGNNVTTSKIAMAKEIKDLRAEVEVLRQAIVGVGQGQELDPMKMKLFPDIEKNHWAYEAVEELAKQGLLEGYPDGTFSGDRMMTRYEFAEVVYRAMQKGLKVNEKLIQEFEPELERFRIDVISKDKDGNPVIERVRVNDKKDVAETANA